MAHYALLDDNNVVVQVFPGMDEYADGVDVVRRSAVEYIGAWRSVNDVQAQLGKYAFERFIEDVERIVSEYSYVEVHYLTRVWIAQK